MELKSKPLALLLASAVSYCFGLNTRISKRLKGKQNTETLGYLASDSCKCEGLKLGGCGGVSCSWVLGFFFLCRPLIIFKYFVTQKTILEAK